MVRACTLALLTAGWALSTPATIGYFAWQHQNSGVGWFSLGVLTNDEDSPTTSNVQLEDVRLVVTTDLGGMFQYVFAPGVTRTLIPPQSEPGVKSPAGLSQTLTAQINPAVAYHTREFNPLAACSTNAACVAGMVDGLLSTDRIVRAELEYRVVLLDSAWHVNLYPGSVQFERDFDDSHVYNVVMGEGLTPFLLYGAGSQSYVNIDLSVPGHLTTGIHSVPEPAASVLLVLGLGFFSIFAGKLRSAAS